jgi:hypothetical protein
LVLVEVLMGGERELLGSRPVECCTSSNLIPKEATGNISVRFVPNQVSCRCVAASGYSRVVYFLNPAIAMH